VSSGGIGCGGSDSAGTGGANDDTPAVVASGQVGILDWSQIKADNESSLTEWLSKNGYPYSAGASTVFSYYVGKGWYFLAFRINQQAVAGGGTICRSLGPIALSFPTSVPVVPSAMASADAATDSSYQQVSWRIFGITHGDVQLTFSNANSYDKVLWYSGAISDASLASLGGLAATGDRLTRLALTFTKSASSTDVDLELAPATDYRGVEDVYVHDDSMCSVGPHSRLARHGLLLLFGLATLGLLFWRRWR